MTRFNRLSLTTVILMIVFLSVIIHAQESASPPAAQPQPAADKDAVQAAPPDDIAVSPSRLELTMLPGTERTVAINIVYSAGSTSAPKIRLVAYPGDWNLSKEGEIEFYRPGTQPRSAAPWLIYSPTEPVAMPGQANPVRVTISVPKDAAPGDHLAVLFIEPRPENLKLEPNKKQMRFSFRMAVIFYIMVPQLTQKTSLQNLKAERHEKGIVVIPTFKNEGNSHVRPIHSIKIVDSAGRVAAEMPDTELLPVLSGAEMSMPLVIEKPLPPGAYSVQYRVSFKDGNPLTEGHTSLIIKNDAEQKTEGEASKGQPNNQEQ
jgi:methionine-rich copper-binding protein CopC